MVTSVVMPGVSVTVRGVGKTYGRAPNTVNVLTDISLDIAASDRVALLGKSGSGKSTLLHLLAGLDLPTDGSIAVDGVDLAHLGRDALAEYRSHTVGLIFQAFHLIPDRSAWRNVEVPLIFAGVPPRDRRERSQQMLANVGLGHRLEHTPPQLSGGEKQRVAIARALVTGPRLLLADEPTGNLDSRTAEEIVELILEHLERSSASLVLVTHDPDVAGRCARRTLNILDGRVFET